MNTMIPEEPLQLFDNYGLWHVPFWQKPWFIICASLIGCLILAGLVYAFLRYRGSNKKRLSPCEQALYDLEMLKKKGLNKPENASPFYAGLTTILKAYISSLFLHDVRSNTDQQMIEHTAHMPLFDAQKQGLSRIFSAGELIKFAQQGALEEQMEQDWRFCFNFVKPPKEPGIKK